MRLIPAGMFLMGDAVYAPIHGVQLTAFCMDEAEVTVSAYATCATCSAPDTTTNCNWGVAGRESHPVNCVDWAQARAYCQSREVICRPRPNGNTPPVAPMGAYTRGAMTRLLRSCAGEVTFGPGQAHARCAPTHWATHHSDCSTWQAMFGSGHQITTRPIQDPPARMS
ncbi:MAG: SUMF1/EgtB/PvdO family nonheme iron enzyme [Deltaproteobacteria bacterium]|nr:SUMF1/EgtB/PvdO family nonheme iron enzyme [Deltaproteobacteria bacterium]